MRYLGVDFGLKKIGLAISEGQIASPLKILEVSGLNDSVSKLTQVIKKQGIDRVVIGVPESGQVKKAARKFISKLKIGLKNELVSVIETEETLSTNSAKNLMIDLRLPKKARAREDAYSAVIILQNFLDSIT